MTSASPPLVPRVQSPELWRPMLPTVATEPFDSPDWLFELKWGGVRTLAFVEGGRVRLRGQNGRDLSEVYPELQSLAENLGGRSAVLDGEVVALGPAGVPDLTLLRPRLNRLLHPDAAPPRSGTLLYQACDLLMLDGIPLLTTPLWMRRNLLHKVFRPSKTGQVTEFISSDGAGFFEAISDLRLDGMLAKHKFSFYHPGQRTADWIEIPALNSAPYVIGGYAFGGGRKGEAFQWLLLGAFRAGELIYVGRATAGMASPEAWSIVRSLEQHHTPVCPFVVPPRINRLVHWCKPHLVCQVRAGEPGPAGELRFAVFATLRPDLPPDACTLDLAE